MEVDLLSRVVIVVKDVELLLQEMVVDFWASAGGVGG